MRAARIILLLALVLLALAQVVPVARQNPPVVADLHAPPAVADTLREACYDCHSHETRWPWYARVAPVSWLLAHDVNEGREHLNFSTWGTLGPRKRVRLLGKIAEDVEEGEMPPWLYTLPHPTARLAAPERQALIAWARSEAQAADIR